MFKISVFAQNPALTPTESEGFTRITSMNPIHSSHILFLQNPKGPNMSAFACDPGLAPSSLSLGFWQGLAYACRVYDIIGVERVGYGALIQGSGMED